MTNVLIQSANALAAEALRDCLSQYGFTCLSGKPQAADVQVVDLEDAVAVGAGERLPRPFRADALAAAIRRAAMPTESLALGDGWEVSADERVLKHKASAAAIMLTEKECALLIYLLARPDHAATRQELLENVWGYGDDVATRTLETHMYRLRAKLKEATGSEELLMTTETGYRLAL